MNKPYAESCDQNKDAILEVLQSQLSDSKTVLEIGSGTGQHAVYFAEKMPHLTWHTSDQASYLPGIKLWLDEADLENTKSPFELNVTDSTWPDLDVDAVFTANTLHIMNDAEVQSLFEGIGQLLAEGARFIVYGPFNYNRDYTSESNAKFDVWLKSRNTGSSIKHFEDVCALAANEKMKLNEDITMPANNRILVWEKG